MKQSISFEEGLTIVKYRDKSKPMKYFDWKKAKQLCKGNPKATITGGLQGDWDMNSDIIFIQGKFIKGYFWTKSFWATPIVDIDGEEVECWTYEEQEIGCPNWWIKKEKTK